MILPLIIRGYLEVMKLIAISIALENEEFKYIEAEESILCID